MFTFSGYKQNLIFSSWMTQPVHSLRNITQLSLFFPQCENLIQLRSPRRAAIETVNSWRVPDLTIPLFMQHPQKTCSECFLESDSGFSGRLTRLTKSRVFLYTSHSSACDAVSVVLPRLSPIPDLLANFPRLWGARRCIVSYCLFCPVLFPLHYIHVALHRRVSRYLYNRASNYRLVLIGDEFITGCRLVWRGFDVIVEWTSGGWFNS